MGSAKLDVDGYQVQIDNIFQTIVHSSDDGSRQLLELLTKQARELSIDNFNRLLNDVNNKIFELSHGSSVADKLGSIAAVNALIQYFQSTDELSGQTSRLANYLRGLIPNNDVDIMREAAKSLGKLAMPGGTFSGEFVEFEMSSAIEWLTTTPDSSTKHHRKHAALLIISSISQNAPSLVYPYVNSILDQIWRGLRDSKLAIRLDAAECLKNCLRIIRDREIESSKSWFNKLFQGCAYGFTLNTTESLHGSLLVYRELVSMGGPFLQERYDELFSNTFRYRDSKHQTVRNEVYLILPLLAEYNPQVFADKYLHVTMQFYLSQFKRDKAQILTSVGDIASQVENKMSPYLDSILDSIRDSLLSKYKARKDHEVELFYCVSKLASSMGATLSKHLTRDLLDLLLNCTLSDHMQITLQVIKQKIPPLEPMINEKLLNLLCLYLSGDNYHAPGSPKPLKPLDCVRARAYRDALYMKKTGEINNDEILVQALKMLSFFSKSKLHLAEFVRFITIAYIEHPSPQVRKIAAITSSQLFSRDSIVRQTSINSLNAVSEVLDKLLTITITDPVPEIRLEVLNSLNTEFDPQLSQADNVRLLFMILNDESFEIQKQAIVILGRLSSLNPAYIVPSLRKVLIQLLTKLEYSSNKEESATLLALLISSSRDITKPYLKSIIDVLLPMSSDSSASVASTSLKALGELSVVGGQGMKPYLGDLMPLILETFQDQSNPYKRDAALKTLGQLASSSGYVIDPLLDYPQLLGMLINILKTESSPSIRRETCRLMGILGALDPYKQLESNTKIQTEAPPIDIGLLIQGMSPSNEEYYPTVVISTLMKILKDPFLSTHHTAVIQAVMHIFQALGLRCVSFLSSIIPGIINVMHSCPPSMLEFYFQQLGSLILIVKQHIRPFVPEIFKVVSEFFSWENLQMTLIMVIENISKSLEGEFKDYLPQTLSLLLKVLNSDTPVAVRILKSLVIFGSNLEEYAHLVIPSVIDLFEMPTVRKSAVITMGRLARNVSLNDYASRIIHGLLRLLQHGNDEIINVTMNTLCLLLLQLKSDYTVFVPVVNKVIMQKHIQNITYDQLVNKLLNGEALPTNLIVDNFSEHNANEVSEAEIPSAKLPVNQQILKNAWECSNKRTKEDWQDWIKRLSIQLLKESPSHALRACSGLAGIYYPLARELFNASFASCWNELYTQFQEDLVSSLCVALSSSTNPPEIHQTLLNLVEFMEHDDKPLPIRIPTLGQYAQKCHAYAKALHYKELEFIQEPSTPTIEALISINNQLHQTDAAIGILKHAQQHHDLQLKETWYEKLQRWDDALRAYNDKDDSSIEVTMGKMRCLHALGEWEQLSTLAQERWSNSSTDIKRAIAPLAAAAAWGLGQWESMDNYIKVMKAQSPDRSFFNAILCLHRNNFEEAATHIFNARELLVTEMTALVNESYNRAYGVVVRIQMIAELEEIIQYKKLPTNSEKRVLMRQTWNKRLLGCQKNVDIWQRMLKVRALVVKPKQDMTMWIKFANLCRKSGRMGLAQKALNSLLEEGDTARAPPHVVYTQLKYMWAAGAQNEALNHLISFTSTMAHDLGLDPSNMIAQNVPKNPHNIPAKNVEEYTKLLARCFLKQGEWQVALQSNWRTENADTILGSYLLATHFDSTWYKAWHNWALANFEVISLMTSQKSTQKQQLEESFMENGVVVGVNLTGTEEYSSELIQRHVVPAIKGFFHSISLADSSFMQDTLRLLTLWFTFGGLPEPAQAMVEGFSMVKIDTWLQVIPQLISRIHQPNQIVSRSLLALLSDIGKAHPQALVYPLSVAIKSESASRQRAALSIIEKMRMHSPVLVEQSELVSDELIRVAVLWHELWYEGLDDASRQFFGEHNTEKMFNTLEPLHAMLNRGPETLREVSFQNAYGRYLNDAYEWVMNYRRTQDVTNLNQAWDIYYNVFRRISRQLPQLQSIDLHHVSPRLLGAIDLELAIPGTYEAGSKVIKIVKFQPVMSVISSKQRPRKMSIMGSDGKEYTFCLKGHEDNRQDNLVMQLFGLVNTLLSNDPECFQRHLDIQIYSATPLSPKVGLIGWVPNSDTFHVLISSYRESRKILLNIEHRIMLQMAPDYDNLTLLQKVEVFTYALDNTRGQDLYKVLWLKSRSSESWLERRTTYTRSLAVMSMTGYILGLGDRHPSNLMLDRITGQVVHIDYGDCFEAAILREKYPEKVPFRLTRMLTYAMEVSGIEGSFRITCENVMRVLRDNKESLMAMLEAFAYDPLINWGLDLPTQTIAEQAGLTLLNPSELLRSGSISAEEAARLEVQQKIEIRNARASMVLKRITDKLTGNDFKRFHELDVSEQVDKLIQQATSVENLCQHFIGWCSFW